jgi:ParB family transcriptional regulator, chromosome partitioning protein
VVATSWALPEPDALLLERLMRAAEADSALEQGWLVRELCERFGLSLTELSRRFDKTPSWVSRRLVENTEPSTRRRGGGILIHG